MNVRERFVGKKGMEREERWKKMWSENGQHMLCKCVKLLKNKLN